METLVASSALLAFVALTPSALQPPQGTPPIRFQVNVLDSLGNIHDGPREEAVAINEKGETVGSVCYGYASLAAHWSPDGELTLLSTPQAGGDSFACDINEDGTVVGYAIADAAPQAFLWTANTGKVPLSLPSRAVPLAINDAGTIAYSYPSATTLAAALWSASTGTLPVGGLAGDLLVRDVSVDHSVVGIAGGAGLPARAFRWNLGGGMVELGVPPGFLHSHGNAINDHGFVVGLSRAEERDQATRWAGTSAPVLLAYVRAGDTQSAALAVNNKGWVVGIEFADDASLDESIAVLWIVDTPHDLNQLLKLPAYEPDLRVTCALDVNDQGQIAARGLVNGVERALRLDPQ